jgi:hypothetical protein
MKARPGPVTSAKEHIAWHRRSFPSSQQHPGNSASSNSGATQRTAGVQNRGMSSCHFVVDQQLLSNKITEPFIVEAVIRNRSGEDYTICLSNFR